MESNNDDIIEKMLIIKEQLNPFVGLVKDAKYKIQNENISNYPIFVAHQDEVEIGIPLINRADSNSFWSINASTLEEFYTKKLIKEEKLEEFKNLYKNHKNDICFFVVSELGAQYIFFPA